MRSAFTKIARTWRRLLFSLDLQAVGHDQHSTFIEFGNIYARLWDACWEQGWTLFSKCRAARFALQILKSAALRACLRCSASALRFAAAALRCGAKKHKRCSGSLKTQALQRYKSLLHKPVEKAWKSFFLEFRQKKKTCNFLLLFLPLQRSPFKLCAAAERCSAQRWV